MEKKDHSSKNIGRREFLKRFRSAAAVVGASSLAGCVSDKEASKVQSEMTASGKKKGEMTYRVTPTTGDKVSLLGYGCLRWFSVVDKETGKIDQEGVNRLASALSLSVKC